MSSEDVSRFLYNGSPFLPSLSRETITKLATQMQSQRQPFQLIVALEMRASIFNYAKQLLLQVDELGRNFGTTKIDIATYAEGYDAPLKMMMAAILAESLGDNEAIKMVCPPTNIPQMQKLDDRVRQNISLCRKMLKEDRTCVIFFDTEEATPFAKDIYYHVGLLVAKHTYIAYLKNLIPT